MKNNKKYNNKKNINLKDDLQKMILACSLNTINKNFDLLIENQKLKVALIDIRDYVINLCEDEYDVGNSMHILNIIRDVLDTHKVQE